MHDAHDRRSASQKTMSSDIRMKNMWIDFSRNARPSPGGSDRTPEQAARAAREAAREAQPVEQRLPVVRACTWCHVSIAFQP